MLSKSKLATFIGMLYILFATLSSQAYYFSEKAPKYYGSEKASKTCTTGDCSPERKELTPAEKECIDDVRAFVFSYEIIRGMHTRYAKEFGSVPTAVQQDLADADSAYYEFQKYVQSNRTMAAQIVNFAATFLLMGWHTPGWALAYCDEMYNKEMNDMFGSHFSPTSNDPFLKSNYVCHTSYKDALENMRRLLSKYKNGHKCE